MLNPGAVTVEDHNQLRNALSNRDTKRAKRNHLSSHATLIIIILNTMVGNKIRALDVGWEII